MMVRGMDTEALKQYMLAHVQAKRPEAGYCFFGYALTDYQSQAHALGVCGQDTTRLKATIDVVITSVNELKAAMAEARCKFEADPFPSSVPKEEHLQ